MRIHHSIIQLLAICTILGCNPDSRYSSGSDRPDILIIFIDDMGYADPSCFGNPAISTPNIDGIARRGLKFTNFYVNSPICSPSRTALMTGQYPMRYKIHSYIASSEQNRKRGMADFLDPSAPTLARTLRQNGYRTGHFGKWHLGGGRNIGDVPQPKAYGYDKSLVSFEGIGNRVLFPEDRLSEQSAQLGQGNIVWAPKHMSTGIYVDSALAFVKENSKDPFYINLFPNDVHDPFLPAPEQLKAHKESSENPFEQRFFAVLRELDNQIGRLLHGLEELGRLENTIVIFTSDNGPTDWPYYYSNERYPEDYKGKFFPPGYTGQFFGRKWSLYEGGIRMPFIIQWKKRIPANKTDSTTVMAAYDLFPSICKLAGVPYPEKLDGADKSNALLGHPMEETEAIMWEYGSGTGGSIMPGNSSYISPTLAIREGQWKLLVNTDSTDLQLFNLAMDPGEKMNFVESEEEIASRLAEKVLSWRRGMPVELISIN
jgi:arylsulfatase A-like enzyme